MGQEAVSEDNFSERWEVALQELAHELPECKRAAGEEGLGKVWVANLCYELAYGIAGWLGQEVEIWELQDEDTNFLHALAKVNGVFLDGNGLSGEGDVYDAWWSEAGLVERENEEGEWIMRDGELQLVQADREKPYAGVDMETAHKIEALLKEKFFGQALWRGAGAPSEIETEIVL